MGLKTVTHLFDSPTKILLKTQISLRKPTTFNSHGKAPLTLTYDTVAQLDTATENHASFLPTQRIASHLTIPRHIDINPLLQFLTPSGHGQTLGHFRDSLDMMSPHLAYFLKSLFGEKGYRGTASRGKMISAKISYASGSDQYIFNTNKGPIITTLQPKHNLNNEGAQLHIPLPIQRASKPNKISKEQAVPADSTALSQAQILCDNAIIPIPSPQPLQLLADPQPLGPPGFLAATFNLNPGKRILQQTQTLTDTPSPQHQLQTTPQQSSPPQISKSSSTRTSLKPMATRKSQRLLAKQQKVLNTTTASTKKGSKMIKLPFDEDSYEPQIDATMALNILQATGLEINGQIEDMVNKATQNSSSQESEQSRPSTPLHDDTPPRFVQGSDLPL